MSGRHVDSITLKQEATLLLSPEEQHLARGPSRYLEDFKRFEREILVAIAGYLGARCICTAWECGASVCSAMKFDSWDNMAVSMLVVQSIRFLYTHKGVYMGSL